MSQVASRMFMEGMAAARLDADIVRYLAGAADETVAVRLSAVLLDDAEARTRFAVLARLHGHLGEIGRRLAAGDPIAAQVLAPPERLLTETLPSRVLLEPQRWTRWVAVVTAAAAAVVLALAMLTMAMVDARTRDLIPTIAEFRGTVQVLRGSTVVPMAPGLRLRAGDRITAGLGSSLDITMTGGRCTLGADAEIEIKAADELHRRILLVRGTIDTDLDGRVPIAVCTSAAEIAVTDAAATITIGRDSTAVSVTRGKVEIVSADGNRSSVPAGALWSGQAAGITSLGRVVPLVIARRN